MLLARLLTATVLFSAASLLAQQQNVAPAASNRLTDQNAATQNTRPDPTRIFENASRSFRLDSLSLGKFVDSSTLRADDTVCYTMRSYVVARDSKDSDAVHPVGYSTCQRASKYQLKTTNGSIPPMLSH